MKRKQMQLNATSFRSFIRSLKTTSKLRLVVVGRISGDERFSTVAVVTVGDIFAFSELLRYCKRFKFFLKKQKKNKITNVELFLLC